LYLRVATGVVRHWRSFEPDEAETLPTLSTLSTRSSLPTTTTALLEGWLDWLEAPAQHGRALVRHALGDLAAARNGLAGDELLDLLARDDQVRVALHTLSPNSPEVNPTLPLPVALWARLYADVERLLTEREADGTRLLTFYHGQLRQVVEERCLQ